MIRKAIIAAAGLGTRFLPASKAQPKEMLAVVDKPVIQYIVEEVVASGIEEIIFVTSLGKRAIEDHFDRNFELELRLKEKGKLKELEEITKVTNLAKFAFVRQTDLLGDGHAALTAHPFIEPGEAVCVLFGDDIIRNDTKPALKQLIDLYEEKKKPVVGLLEVPKEDVARYGVIGGRKMRGQAWKIDTFVEKPKVEEAPSNLIACARYIITPEIFDLLKTQSPGKDGEIRLANAFISYLEEGKELLGCVMEGKRYDCGSKLGFLKAQIEFGLAHPDTGAELKKYLSSGIL